jgi:hypothetical protein
MPDPDKDISTSRDGLLPFQPRLNRLKSDIVVSSVPNGDWLADDAYVVVVRDVGSQQQSFGQFDADPAAIGSGVGYAERVREVVPASNGSA